MGPYMVTPFARPCPHLLRRIKPVISGELIEP